MGGTHAAAFHARMPPRSGALPPPVDVLAAKSRDPLALQGFVVGKPMAHFFNSVDAQTQTEKTFLRLTGALVNLERTVNAQLAGLSSRGGTL